MAFVKVVFGLHGFSGMNFLENPDGRDGWLAYVTVRAAERHRQRRRAGEQSEQENAGDGVAGEGEREMMDATNRIEQHITELARLTQAARRQRRASDWRRVIETRRVLRQLTASTEPRSKTPRT